MALVVGDRIQETTTTTGTGTITLLGAVTQFQSFAAGVGNGNSTYYTIADQSGVNWEEGIGTYTTSGSTLTRSVLSSSNANALVNFPAGTKNVFCSYPAEAAVLAAPYAYPTVQPTLNLDFVNSGQVDPRITFVRNSTATYYDGKTTAMAEQNLLLYSQDFTNSSWAKSSATATGTYAAPDGTNTANLLTPTAQYGGVIQSIYLISGVTYTVSIYALAVTGTNTYTFRNDTSSTNLGTFTPTGSWARYFVTFTAVATGTASLWPIQDRNASGFGSVYIWGAQLEQRSSATAYTPTTTSAITNYIPVLMTAPAGVPRLDYNPTTGQPLGLLIEEARTNLLTYSSDFSNAVWVASGSSKTPNIIIAPDGSLTGCLQTATAISNALFYHTVPTLTTGQTYTASRYVKAGTKSFCTFGIFGLADAYYDLSSLTYNFTGTGAVSASITDVGNGWRRITATWTWGTATTYNLYLAMASSLSSTSGITIGDTIYYWGAQLEAGSFATSYTPTTTTAVTRNADQASMIGTNFSSWYNQSQGSLYVEFDLIGLLKTAQGMELCGMVNASGSGIELYINTLGTQISAYLGASSSIVMYTPAISTKYKTLLAYTQTNLNTSINGATPVTTTGTLPSSIISLGLGFTPTTNGNYMDGHIRKISYYPVALSSANLQALTS